MEGNAAMKKKYYKGYLLTGMKVCGRLFLLYLLLLADLNIF